MASPYDVKYFQIWNEAHPVSGFWVGDLDSYMSRVHLPAARIIRELGGKVVYGGWPCCGSLDELIALLDKHDAWKSIDVIDVHYFGLQAFERLRQAAADRGFPEMGVWQTEVCFEADPTYVSNNYPRFVDWSLRHGLEQSPERYKIFFFAYWSPDDIRAYGYRNTLLSGERLSPHGQSLLTLGELLGKEALALYDKVEFEPELGNGLDDRRSAFEAFKTDKRIVVAVQWVDGEAVSRRSIAMRLPSLKNEDIATVERFESAGWRRKLDLKVTDNNGSAEVEVDVPLLDRTDFRSKLRDSSLYRHGFYVVITLK